MEQLVVVVVCISLQSGYNVSTMSYNLHSLHQSTIGSANWKPPRKKETKQSFPFMIHFYLCFSFIRTCCISKPLGRYVTRPTCEKLHALISHIWVAFFAPSCTRALILLSICTDNTPPYRHNGVFARDVCVLRIHSQGSVICARVLPLRMEGEKPVVRMHGHMHLV